MHDSPYRRFAPAASVILGAAVILSCGESPTAALRFGAPATLQIVTGKTQTGIAGQQLPEPLTVQVLDSAGHALPQITVSWAILSGSGTLFARVLPTITDTAGLVLVVWQLGSPVGMQQVSANCCQNLSATFTADAQIPLAQRVSLIGGGGQQDTVGATLAQPLVIRVLHADGTPVAGAAVAWRAVSRGSTYSPADTHTDNQGQARTIWTVGTVAETETTAVSVQGFPTMFALASVTAGAPVRVTISRRNLPVLGMIGDTAILRADNALAFDRYGNVADIAVGRVVDDSIAVTISSSPNYIVALHHGTTWLKAQLGQAADSVPITVLGFTGMSDGGGHTCGSSVEGDTYCWGENSSGSIGDGTETYRPHPVRIGQGLGLQVPFTDNHTCALDGSASAWCWGTANSGQLGDGSPNYASEFVQTSPVAVTGGHVFSSVRTGFNHTCALATNGDAYCWGSNDNGELGRDTLTGTCVGGGTRCSNTPILVDGGLQFAQVSAGFVHSCGVTTSGAAYCWGLNASGQVGNDSATAACSQFVPGPCSFTPRLVEGGIVFASATAGGYFSCGLSVAGDGYCWGHGDTGELGNGLRVSSTTPVKVSGGLAFADVQAGRWNSCGLTTGGKIYCWGGSYGPSPVPVKPSPPFTTMDLQFTAIAVGGDDTSGHACALTIDHDLYCWSSGAN
jgi:alpha-tubulin suppressor-like RCC1 family protein